MSIARDVGVLAVLGIGAFIAFKNADKIAAWLGSQFFAPAGEAAAAVAEKTGENVAETFTTGPEIISAAIMGDQPGVSEAVISAAQNPLVKMISGVMSPTFPTILEQIGKISAPSEPAVISTPISAVAPAPTHEQAVAAAAQIANYANLPAVFMSSPATPTAAAAPVNTYPAVLSSAQQYAKTFADPGSQAHIEAFGW